MSVLERKVPPVALFILFIIASASCKNWFANFAFDFPFPTIVVSLMVILSGYIGCAGVLEFRKAKTTVNPIKVGTASTVVESGIFAYTRNPMYLALLILLFAYGYWQQNIISLVLPFGFIVYMNRFQIQPEEQALGKLFGEQYISYKSRVRRWI